MPLQCSTQQCPRVTQRRACCITAHPCSLARRPARSPLQHLPLQPRLPPPPWAAAHAAAEPERCVRACRRGCSVHSNVKRRSFTHLRAPARRRQLLAQQRLHLRRIERLCAHRRRQLDTQGVTTQQGQRCCREHPSTPHTDGTQAACVPAPLSPRPGVRSTPRSRGASPSPWHPAAHHLIKAQQRTRTMPCA